MQLNNTKKYTDPIEIVDGRKNPRFMVDDVFVDHVGKIVGPYGAAVYNSLLRHSNKLHISWPSVDLIAKQWNISRPRVIQSIEQLESLNLIRVDRTSGKHNSYYLRDVSEWGITSQCGLPVDQDTSKPDLLVDDQTSKRGLPVKTPNDPEPVNVVYPKVLKDLNTPPPSPPTSKISEKNKRKKIGIDFDAEIEREMGKFKPDVQTAVKSFIAVVASENKTGTISQSRQWSLLCQLSGVSATTSDDIFRAALLEATERNKPNVNYLKEIIKTKSQRQKTFNFKKKDQPVLPDQPASEDLRRVKYAQNWDGTWTRTDHTGSETQITNEEFERIKSRQTEDYKEPAKKIVSGLVDAMSM